MSRIGKKPVAIPKGVTISTSEDTVSVKGPKGELTMSPRPEVTVQVRGDEVVIACDDDSRDPAHRAYHGLTRALIQNMVIGVSDGYHKRLEINGVGYNAKLEGKSIVLNLGFANPVKVAIPPTVTIEVPNPTTIVIRGSDKQQVGEIAAQIRRLRKPEPYKGKGIKYDYEIIRRKAGKAFGSS